MIFSNGSHSGAVVCVLALHKENYKVTTLIPVHPVCMGGLTLGVNVSVNVGVKSLYM